MSVASLSGSWRCSTAPRSPAQRRPSAVTESKSPTAWCTSRPSVRARSTPESAATTTASAGIGWQGAHRPVATGDEDDHPFGGAIRWRLSSHLSHEARPSAGITQFRSWGR